MPSISKILVANRGEIAIRVFRSCREQGISTVAIYSDADRHSAHLAFADEAYRIEGATPSASYLDADAIVELAKRCGADAIHPGYGFLSERPHFARACEAAGVILIGPPATAMETMGDKVASRKAMMAAKVPVVPGREDIRNEKEAVEAAQAIGYPVMIKASAGGGGKGMRMVHEAELLPAAFQAAQRESQAAFGDDRIFIERAITKARHVEIQLMADRHGNVVALNERDCSVQRRHQKVIEEAPCPDEQMTPELRAAMGEVACQAARAVNYVGAGTVEFLYENSDEGPRFYFLEMNTRLQVEHPVTELTTDRDLVWDQIRVAAGEELGYSQQEVGLHGHALECRVYAEDAQRFLPSPGKIQALRWPQGPGIRVDAAVVEGGEVSSHYDPMIAKIITWGRDREAAVGRMRRALRETVIVGIETNIPFHLRVLEEPDFLSGQFCTHYIQKHPALTEAASADPQRSALVAAALVAARSQQKLGRRSAAPLSSAAAETATGAEISAWQAALRWRAGL